MANKKKDDRDRVVFSTHPGEGNAFFDALNQGDDDENDKLMTKDKQKIYVYLDRKQRRGKEVTCVEGIRANPDHRKSIANTLKTACGAGGTVKEGVIMVQGNHVDKVVGMLRDMGFGEVKIKGGY